ncbi:MAG TPA: glutathione ABC transporter substrate-binding protein [bacterium]|nr:glutathione ABC transporter substrate-binding protein [bacterium]
MGTRVRNGLTRRQLLRLTGAGVAGATLFGGGAPWVRKASAQGTRTLTIGLAADAVSLDPFNTNDNLSLTVERCVYDGLVGFTPDYKLRPELATSWEASKDAKTFTFHLRPNVKFHDGTPLNAAAVKLNFDRARDPANKLTRLSLVVMISSVDVVNDTTVRFTLKDPFGAMLYNFAHPAARIISPAAIAKGEDYIARNMVGSGPFRFVSWTPGQQIVLERNPDFWQSGQPEADRLIIRPVVEDASRVAMLLSGDANFIYPIPGVQVDAVSKASGVTVQKRWSIYANWVSMNCQHAPFQDVRVRQAMNYAIDKNAIVNVVERGYARPLDAPDTPGVAGYSPVQSGGWPYDVTKAKELLSEAGFAKGFETTLWSGNQTDQLRLGEAMQQMLAKVGVTLRLDPMEAGTLSAIRFKPFADNQSQMNLAGWSPSTGDADWALRPLLASQSWPPALFNIAFYKNPQVDAAFAAALATADQAKRDRIYADVSKVIWNDAPWIFLHNGQNLAGVRNGTSGVWIMADNTCDFREAALRAA